MEDRREHILGVLIEVLGKGVDQLLIQDAFVEELAAQQAAADTTIDELAQFQPCDEFRQCRRVIRQHDIGPSQLRELAVSVARRATT